jgi:hypothetical protein
MNNDRHHLKRAADRRSMYQEQISQASWYPQLQVYNTLRNSEQQNSRPNSGRVETGCVLLTCFGWGLVYRFQFFTGEELSLFHESNHLVRHPAKTHREILYAHDDAVFPIVKLKTPQLRHIPFKSVLLEFVKNLIALR